MQTISLIALNAYIIQNSPFFLHTFSVLMETCSVMVLLTLFFAKTKTFLSFHQAIEQEIELLFKMQAWLCCFLPQNDVPVMKVTAIQFNLIFSHCCVICPVKSVWLQND